MLEGIHLNHVSKIPPHLVLTLTTDTNYAYYTMYSRYRKRVRKGRIVLYLATKRTETFVASGRLPQVGETETVGDTNETLSQGFPLDLA